MRIFTASLLKDDTTGHELRKAARYGDATSLSELCDDTTLNSCDKKGNTSLMIAAKVGNHKAVTYLCKRGAKLDLCNNDGNSALLLACRFGRTGCVETLLGFGANPNLCNTVNDILYQHCIRSGPFTLTQHMNTLVWGGDNPSPNVSPLMLAAALGHETITELLLYSHKTDTNLRDNYGYSATMYAALFGQSDCLEQLLHHGANISFESYRNKDTAAKLVDNNKSTACKQVLWKHRAWLRRRPLLLARKLREQNRATPIVQPATKKRDQQTEPPSQPPKP